jgi:hypothetical protein
VRLLHIRAPLIKRHDQRRAVQAEVLVLQCRRAATLHGGHLKNICRREILPRVPAVGRGSVDPGRSACRVGL